MLQTTASLSTRPEMPFSLTNEQSKTTPKEWYRRLTHWEDTLGIPKFYVERLAWSEPPSTTFLSRGTVTNRLFQNGTSDKVIREITGLRSNAQKVYKKPLECRKE